MPALNSTERDRLRRRLGHTATSLPDEVADDLFNIAEDAYGDYSRRVVFQAAVVEGRLELWAQAAKRVTYRQNQSAENMSDIAKQLKQLLEEDQEMLNTLIAGEQGPAVRWGKFSRDRGYRSYPNG